MIVDPPWMKFLCYFEENYPLFFSFLSFVSVVIAESMQQCVRGNHNLSQFMKKITEQKNVVQSTSVSAELYE